MFWAGVMIGLIVGAIVGAMAVVGALAALVDWVQGMLE